MNLRVVEAAFLDELTKIAEEQEDKKKRRSIVGAFSHAAGALAGHAHRIGDRFVQKFTPLTGDALESFREGHELTHGKKTAAELTPAGREHIKTKNFALSAKQSDTGKPAYPIHDKAHAANALARVKQFGSPAEKSEVYKDVAKKFPELAARSDVPAVKARSKEASVLKRLGSALTSPKGEHAIELAGLGVLAVPGLDTLQAKMRSRDNPHEWEKKRMLGEGAHAALDVGGLGILAAPELHKLLSNHG